jgi:peptidoglycan/xylan/chitin deacetylase (PgdA/CDA1 family)
VAHRLRREPLPHNAIIFTFDDGFAECYEVVRPILLAEGIDAVFFVTTALLDEENPFFECTLSLCLTAAVQLPPDRLDRAVAAIRHRARELTTPDRVQTALRRLPLDGHPVRREVCLWILGLTESDADELARTCELLEVDGQAYVSRRPIFLSSAQVTQLARDGFTIGAHGLTHRTLEGSSVQELEREIVASCAIVKRLTGQERVPFAFPYSGVAIDRHAIEMILSRNPAIDLIFDSGCLRRDPAFIVNRVFADAPSAGFEPALARALSAAWSVPSAWFRCS